MRYPAEVTAARHERILQEAARLFRERGISGVSLPEIMKAAKLTHGPFYNHFASKDALVIESLTCAMETRLQSLKRSAAALPGYLDEYLSGEHRDNPGDGCVMAALAGDVSRNSIASRPFTQYVKDTLAAMSEKFVPDGVQKEDARAEVFRILVGLVGAIILARAVDDKALSDEILARTRVDLQSTTRRRSSAGKGVVDRKSKRSRSGLEHAR